MVNAAGLVADQQLPDYLKQVMQQSIAEYLHMDSQEGLLTPEDKQRAQQMLQEAGQPEGAEPPQGEPDGDEQPTGMLARMAKGGA
jgi:hypothetical protein